MPPMRFPESYRRPNIHHNYQSKPGDPFGVFSIPGRDACGRQLKIIAVDGAETGWDHVSVSLMDHPKRCPSWEEMCFVKRLFWPPQACVVQFHPPEVEYVNQHPGCLHLWRCVSREFPTPQRECV
jgi:hypothetical protein